MAGTVPWLELGGQVALLLGPSHWGRALDPVRSRVDQVGMEAMGGAPCPTLRPHPPQISSKRSSSFKRAIANGQRALPQDGLLDEPGLGVYKRFVRYVAYEILPREVDRHWYFYRHRSCPPPVFMASVTLAQVSLPTWHLSPRPGPALTPISPRSSCSCAMGHASTSGCCRPTTPST